MKYKLKPENTEIESVNATNNLLVFFGKNSDINTVKPIPAIIANKNEYGICLSVITTPSLLAKVSFLIKRVLLKIVNNRGIQKNVLIYINVAKFIICKFVLKKCATASPLDIPNQNIRFHNLSLLSHLSVFAWFKGFLPAVRNWVKSSITHSYRYINSHCGIILKIRLIIKQIIVTFGIIISLLSPNAGYAATRGELLELISNAEKEHNIPKGLLLAVAKTESNLEVYALNINGRSHFSKDKDTALETINRALDKGITNIDIGTAQINYKWHGHKFSSIEDMLSPEVNIKYAAKLLFKLKQEHGNWHQAIRLYHSSKPKHHRQYSRKVVLCWLGV
jgi:hypothetical protein